MHAHATRHITLCAFTLATACVKTQSVPTDPAPESTAVEPTRTTPAPNELPAAIGEPVVFGNLGPRHTGRVEALAFSPDGERFVSVGGESALDPIDAIVWATESGERLATTRTSIATVAAFLDDGVRLFDGALVAWDPGQAPRELARLDGYPISSSNDGGWIYVGGESPTRIMNVATGQLLSVPGPAVEQLWVTADRIFATDEEGHLRTGPLGEATRAIDLQGGTLLAVQPDGRRIAVLTDAGLIRVRELDGVRLGASVEIRLDDLVEEPSLDVGVVRWSPDGRHLALDVRGFANGLVLVIDVPARRLAGRLVDELGNHPTSMAFSPDSARLAYGTEYGRVRVWDAKTDSLLHRTTGHLGTVWDVEISADGQVIASFGDEKARVHGFADPLRELAFGDHEHWVVAGAVTADGSRVVSCSDYGDVNVRAIESGAIEAKYDTVDCQELELHGEIAHVLTINGVEAFDIRSGDAVARWDVGNLSRYGELHMALSPAGDRAALLGDQGVALHELPSGRVLWRHEWGRTASLLNGAIAYAPSGDALFVAEDRLHRFDARTGAELAAIDDDVDGRITAAIYCELGIVIGATDGTVSILDDTLAPTMRWTYPDGGVYSLAGTSEWIVAGGSDGRVRAWPLAR